MDRWLIALLMFTAAAYSGLWGAGFVWDDVPLIVQNQALRDAGFGVLFTSDLWASSGAGEVASGYYRPLVLLSFVADRWMFGLEPLGYHAHSVLWHLVAMVGLFRLVRPIMGRGAALLAVALFGMHPVQSEVVAWVAARNDLMAAALGFFALGLVWLDERPSMVRLIGAGVLTVCAALSKETAFLLPMLLLGADWARGRRDGLGLRLAPVVCGVVFVLILRWIVGVGEAVIPSEGGVRMLWGGLPMLIGGYAASVFHPWPLSSARDLSWISEQSAWSASLGWFGIGVVVLAVLTADAKQKRFALLGLFWAVVLIGITLVPTADKGGYGDRFLYWPMAGLSVVGAALLQRHWKSLVPMVVIAGALTLSVRLPDWKNDRTLWGAAVRDVPTATNEVSLGHALTLHARHKRALVSFVSALAKPGIDLDACGPVVGAAMRTGLPDVALRMGEWAIARGCERSGPMNGWMAMAAALQGKWVLAAEWAHGDEPDPRYRDLIVRAALAKRNGNEAEYTAIEAAWEGLDPLAPQVEVLWTR